MYSSYPACELARHCDVTFQTGATCACALRENERRSKARCETKEMRTATDVLM